MDRAFTHGEEKGTKTYQRRSVPIMGPLRDDLEAWRREQKATSGLVAPSQAGGHLHLGNWRKRVFKPAAAAAGVEGANPYDGRASVRIAADPRRRVPAGRCRRPRPPSADTTWKHSASLFEEARLASSVDPEEAIRSARWRAAAPSDVRPEFAQGQRRHRRLVS